VKAASYKPFPQVCAVICAAFMLAPAINAATLYTLQTFDNQADPTFNQLLGINNSGTIAGYFGSGLDAAHPNKGYVFAQPYGQANYTNENFPGSAQTQVVGINNANGPVTVGFWADAAPGGNNFGFVNQNGTFTNVMNPGTPATGTRTNQLLGINDNNIAAGFFNDGNGNANGYLYNIATKQFTPILFPNGTMTTATGVNNNSVVSGFYMDANGLLHGFVDTNGNFVSYDDPNGTNTMFLGLTNNNLVVGSFVDANGMTEGLVYNLATKTWQSINDPNASANAAFGVNGTTVNGINDKGQLVGFFSDGANVNGFLATPIPEPASFVLIPLGAALFLGLGWRKKYLQS
jgi:hypothetical protein